jgi:hypothetical protein
MGDNMLTRTRLPRLRFVDNPSGDTDTGTEQTTTGPLKEQPAEEQIKFHEQKARRLEDQLKAFNGLTPDAVAALQQQFEDLKSQTQTAEEKALEEAKEAGRSEIRNVLAGERVKTALERALAGRVADPSALLDLDRSAFVKGDAADVDAINTWVQEHSTESTAVKHVDLGQGRERGTNAPNKGVSAGRELFTGSKSIKS